jgi:hypothetical protein
MEENDGLNSMKTHKRRLGEKLKGGIAASALVALGKVWIREDTLSNVPVHSIEDHQSGPKIE